MKKERQHRAACSMTSLIVKYQRYEHTHTHTLEVEEDRHLSSACSCWTYDVGYEEEQATVLMSCAWCIRCASQEKNEGQEWQWRQWRLIVNVSVQKWCALDCLPEGHRVSYDQLVKLIDVFKSIDGLSMCKYPPKRLIGCKREKNEKINVALRTSRLEKEMSRVESSRVEFGDSQDW
jgi:hypothetical protein